MKNIFAFVFCFNHEGKYLFGKRHESRNEYPKMWSLPSLTVDKNVYSSISIGDIITSETVAELFCAKYGKALPNDLMVIRSTKRVRKEYNISISICLSGELIEPSASDKYSEFHWLTIEEVLERNSNKTGTCLSLLIQEEIENNNIRQNINFIEVQPEMLGEKPIETWTDDELWLSCASNYSLLKEGLASSDGDLVREISIDRFLESHLLQLPHDKKIIDIGCGNGELVHFLDKNQYSVSGFDLSPDVSEKYCSEKSLFKKGTIHNLSKIYNNDNFDVIVLNLVCNWIKNLDLLIKEIKSISSSNAVIYITMTAPEFSKNGTWNRESENPQWIIEQPIRRSPFLTMINRGIGPVRFYPHSTPEFITTFAKSGLNCTECQHVFLDSMANDKELQGLLSEKPYLKRHIYYPAFIYFKFSFSS